MTATANRHIVCIPNPVSMPPLLGAARAGALVAFVGRCEKSKGIFDLLEAANEVRGTFSELRLECAGEGDLDEVQRRASELGLRAHLHLPGWIRRRRRDELLTRAAVFVLPSHVGRRVAIHNGKEFKEIEVRPEMIGHFYGEFALTRRFEKHSGPGVGATRSSKFMPLK